MKSNALSYRPQIDGLRFVAIACVFYEHFGFNPFQQYGNPWLSLDPGYYGVDLFFVISGFLITSILLQDSSPSGLRAYKTFMGRRMLRIFPIYYLVILILTGLDTQGAREFAPWLLTYTFNYGVVLEETETPLFYLWSLSVEEQFYVFWPILVLALRNNQKILLVLTVPIICFAYAQICFHIVPSLSPFNYTGLPNRMGSLGLGALGAILEFRRIIPANWTKSRWVEGFAVLLTLVVLAVSFRWRFPLMGCVSLFLVLKAFRSDFRIPLVRQLLENKKLVYLGAISYGLYLYHIPISLYFTPYLFDSVWHAIPFDKFGALAKLQWHPWLIKLPLYSLITIGVAAFSFRFIESPILRLKSRWFPYRKLVETGSSDQKPA